MGSNDWKLSLVASINGFPLLKNQREPYLTTQNKLAYKLVRRFTMQSAKNHPYWETKIGSKTTGKWADITCWLSEEGYCSCFTVRCTRPVTTGNSIANPKMN